MNIDINEYLELWRRADLVLVVGPEAAEILAEVSVLHQLHQDEGGLTLRKWIVRK